MLTAIETPAPAEKAQCPKCGNTTAIRSAPSPGGQRRYDILSDTWGVLRCPACRHRAAWIEFHALRAGQQNT